MKNSGCEVKKIVLIFVILCVNCASARIDTQEKSSNKLLLILMDGFRWDYFDQPNLNLPGFRSMFQEGVRASYMIPDFPSLSYPNYYSIMTGLHVENHGVVGNFMYDPKHKKSFLAGVNSDSRRSFWWEDGEPLWVSAEKQNKTVYMYHWPGCEVTIRGVKPTFCQRYNILSTPHVPQMKNAIVEMISLFKNDTADVVGIYLETPDKYGHKYGVNSVKLNHALEEVDQGVLFLQQRLKENGLDDKVNVMIFSDHGMTNISDTRVVNLTMVINMDDVDVIMDSGPNSYVWPKPGKLDKVYGDIKNFQHPHLKVYKKEDIPRRWFYKSHYRIPPILLVADNGWYIVTPQMKYIFSYFGSGPMQGHHGYDNIEKDMRAIFVAKGPDFKKNMISRPFQNIHLYQMMCHLLDIEAAPNNGSWKYVRKMLQNPPRITRPDRTRRPSTVKIHHTSDSSVKEGHTRSDSSVKSGHTRSDSNTLIGSYLTIFCINIISVLVSVAFSRRHWNHSLIL